MSGTIGHRHTITAATSAAFRRNQSDSSDTPKFSSVNRANLSAAEFASFGFEASSAIALVESFVEKAEIERQSKISRHGLSSVQDSDLAKRKLNQAPLRREDIIALNVPAVINLDDARRGFFMSTEEWDGYVTDVSADEFEGNIQPVRGESGEFKSDTVSVPLWLVPENKRALVQPGAIFRLAAGRFRSDSGSVMHGAKVYFRVPSELGRRVRIDLSEAEAFFSDGS